ncbi:heme acquisition hemophore HasA [Yersinia mollaretii]|uniref:Heme acquisition hemophore HasA n=1 Tax=Yersinia mollaretii TaxID=33060 RepID=A0AA44CPS3_YERMO|nr:heme acquisition protein HasA [Yersinia mollaretii]NIL24594.1 heme acquisition hemophore HasA [Yersinia mollaretii]CNJ43099.1 hemophore HasA [Yersinia mollaretii]
MTISIQFNALLGSATLASYSQTLKVKSRKETISNDVDITETKEAQASAGMCDDPSDDTVGYDFIGIDTGSSCKSNTDIIVEGSLFYSHTPQYTFYGKIESLVLGKDLNPNPDGMGKQLEESQLKLSGLGITSEFDAGKTITENHQGEVHKVINGLIRGNADPLLEILQARGVDINTPLEDLPIASQFNATNEVMADMPAVDTVGTFDSAEILMVA